MLLQKKKAASQHADFESLPWGGIAKDSSHDSLRSGLSGDGSLYQEPGCNDQAFTHP